jgi:hypothetical protein
VKLENDLKASYGINDKKLTILNIYNQDRKQAIDSFKCYWQIDSMIQSLLASKRQRERERDRVVISDQARFNQYGCV